MMPNAMSRRMFLHLMPAALAIPVQGQVSPRLTEFRVDVPEAVVARIMTRVRDTRLPDRLDAPDWRYGANWDYMQALIDYWKTGFNWRRAEANLNRFPQFKARVDGYDLHYYHVRGRGPRPVPLILTHGWPGSVFEFLEAIGPLSDPARFGGRAEDAFDVVVPSIPGYGFSSKPKAPIGAPTVARLWQRLMTEGLGYTRFGAQGGDLGSGVTRELAIQFPENLIGIHVNGISAVSMPADGGSEEERQWQVANQRFRDVEFDYFREHQRKPATVAFALHDNPVGTAAWIIEKMKLWSDSGTNIETAFTKDQLLTNIMIYLVTETAGTAVWLYRGFGDEPVSTPAGGRLNTPLGFASFPAEMPPLNPPRSLVERNHNLVHYTRMPRGGHFACLEQPQLFTEDIRQFFGKLRS